MASFHDDSCIIALYSDDEVDHGNNQAERRFANPNVLERASRWKQQQQGGKQPYYPRPILNVKRLSKYYTRSRRYSTDMTNEVFDLSCDEFLNNVQLMSREAINSLQKQTIVRSENDLWNQERRKRLPDTVFGNVVRMPKTQRRSTMVKALLFIGTPPKKRLDSRPLDYARGNVPNAVALYNHRMKDDHLPVEACGLFVHPRYGYLAASPDFLVDYDGILMVKCPHFARNLLPSEIPQEHPRYCCTLSEDGELRLKTTDKLYFQIQGQLEITGREFCDLVIWTKRGMSIEHIWREKKVWKKMFSKLERFYKQSLLPELVNSRSFRCLPIREPDFVVKAIQANGSLSFKKRRNMKAEV